MYRNSRESKSGEAKVARLIASILVALFLWFWEFVLNPGGNTSFEFTTQVVTVEGVECHGDPMPWQFVIREQWRSNKKDRVKLRVWLSGVNGATRVEDWDMVERSTLYLMACNDQWLGVAYIWDVSSTEPYVHLRVHPPYVMSVVEDASVPGLPGE